MLVYAILFKIKWTKKLFKPCDNKFKIVIFAPFLGESFKETNPIYLLLNATNIIVFPSFLNALILSNPYNLKKYYYYIIIFTIYLNKINNFFGIKVLISF